MQLQRHLHSAVLLHCMQDRLYELCHWYGSPEANLQACLNPALNTVVSIRVAGNTAKLANSTVCTNYFTL